ncbi:hypothetical protein [Metallibacterium sp.]
MKISTRKTRLVLACINLAVVIFHFLTALVGMASNYSQVYDAEMDSLLSAEAWPMGLCAYG